MKKFLMAALLATTFSTAAMADTVSLQAQTGKVVETNLYYDHVLSNGFIVGGDVGANFTGNSKRLLSNDVEAYVGKKFSLGRLSVTPSVGVGETFATVKNYPYYVGYLDADFRLTDRITWNVTKFEYVNAFDEVNKIQSQRVATGLEYKLTDRNSVSADVYRRFLNAPGARPTSYDGFLLSVNHSF